MHACITRTRVLLNNGLVHITTDTLFTTACEQIAMASTNELIELLPSQNIPTLQA